MGQAIWVWRTHDYSAHWKLGEAPGQSGRTHSKWQWEKDLQKEQSTYWKSPVHCSVPFCICTFVIDMEERDTSPPIMQCNAEQMPIIEKGTIRNAIRFNWTGFDCIGIWLEDCGRSSRMRHWLLSSAFLSFFHLLLLFLLFLLLFFSICALSA